MGCHSHLGLRVIDGGTTPNVSDPDHRPGNNGQRHCKTAHTANRSSNGRAREFANQRQEHTLVEVDLPQSSHSSPSSINNKRAITGTYFDSTGEHGFMRSSNGTITSFDAPGMNGGASRKRPQQGWRAACSKLKNARQGPLMKNTYCVVPIPNPAMPLSALALLLNVPSDHDVPSYER